MLVRSLVLATCLAAATSVFAQATDQKAAQNASNWNVFLKLYPPRAVAAKEEGAVGFTVTLDRQGNVTGCQVTHSSGHALLDQETCQLVTLHAQFNPDLSLAPSQTKTHEGLIDWRLPNGVAAVPVPQAVASNQAPEKVVCKKTVRIGTIAGFERTCLTPTEWAKQSDQMKADWEDVQGKKGFTHGN